LVENWHFVADYLIKNHNFYDKLEEFIFENTRHDFKSVYLTSPTSFFQDADSNATDTITPPIPRRETKPPA